MTDCVVNTSALMAILNAEPEASRISDRLDNAERVMISAATMHEAFCVSMRETIVKGTERLQELLHILAPDIAPFDLEQLQVSRMAYSRYGRGTQHKAHLNMGDCFSYALAKSRNLPLLFKGDDFVHTDIRPALKPT